MFVDARGVVRLHLLSIAHLTRAPVRYSGQLVLTTHNVAAMLKMAEKYQIGTRHRR